MPQEQPNYDESKVPSYELPDVLRLAGGMRVSTPEQWATRRTELLNLFRDHVYGRRPGPPQALAFEIAEENPHAMNGEATLKRIVIHSSHEGRSHRFQVVLFIPNRATKPVATFLFINNREPERIDPTRSVQFETWPAEMLISRGFAIAGFNYGDLAPDDAARFREGVLELFEGSTTGERPADAWGALAAWGWGASRALDYFETDPQIDAQRVALVGHSRGGKAALWGCAEDERFAMAVSNNSGCGGAAISRRRYGETVEMINNRFPHWFCGTFKTYNGREDAIPVDQHMLLALIAPRLLYVTSATEDGWADPKGEFLSLVHASPVFSLWGHPPVSPEQSPPPDTPLIVPPRAYHRRTGGHGLKLFDWNCFADFFAGRIA